MHNKKNLAIFLHGTLMEIFQKGVLFRGEALAGKSSLAFALMQKGHRIIADDLVKITKNKLQQLMGTSPQKEKFIAIRPFGIFAVEDIFGKNSVKEKQKIDFVVNLSKEKNTKFSLFGVLLNQYQINSFCEAERVGYIEKIALLDGKEKRFFNDNERKRVENTKNCLCEE